METGMIRQDRRYEREGNRTMSNVILIGFMGCGKSSIAVKLSYRLKQPVTDELIATYSSLTACEVISNAEESLKVESCKLFTVSGTS